MIDVEVTTDNQTGLAGMISGHASQLPFAYSLGLNKLVNAAQGAVKDSLAGKFTLRQPSFIQNTIYRQPGQDFATKTNLSATVRVDPKRNFLAKFEDGGLKHSRSGKDVAIPILREENKGLIIKKGDPLSVAMLMAAIKRSGGKVLRPRLHKGMVRVKVDANKVFMTTNAKGTFILQLEPGDGSRYKMIVAPVLDGSLVSQLAVIRIEDDENYGYRAGALLPHVDAANPEYYDGELRRLAGGHVWGRTLLDWWFRRLWEEIDA